jgi:hypothetical protein
MVEKGLINEKKTLGTVELENTLQSLGLDIETYCTRSRKEATMTISEAESDVLLKCLKTWLLHHTTNHNFNHNIKSLKERNLTLTMFRTRDWEVEDREYELCDGTKLSPSALSK